MDITAFAPIAALLEGGSTLLTGLTALLDPLAGPAASALAIVLLTLAVRAAMIPLGAVQVRAEVARRRLTPKLQALQRKWAKNPERLSREMTALYSAEGTSPLAGMWTALVQLPVISLLYTLFGHAQLAGHANTLFTSTLFGVPLGTSLGSIAGGASALWPGALVVGAVLGALALTAVFSRRQALAVSRATGVEPNRLTRVLASLSFVSVLFAAIAPLAAGVYLVTTTTWTLVERALLRRRLDPAFAPERGALPSAG
jgi:YidC/Oxa1 family membrane protein insertase